MSTWVPPYADLIITAITHHRCCLLMIKPTSDCDGQTLSGFIGLVGAHTVVSSLVLFPDVGYLEGPISSLGGHGIKGALHLGAEPGEADRKCAFLNRAH